MRALALLWLLSAGCISVASAVAQPTALERQLLGAYSALDDDLVAASSVRGAGASPVQSLDQLRAQAVQARALQRFNEDDLSELKKVGCIAEALDATVVARPCTLASATERNRLARVLAEENRARRDILEWAVFVVVRQAGRAQPTASDRQELRGTYHRLLREAAHFGLFETAPGKFEEIRS